MNSLSEEKQILYIKYVRILTFISVKFDTRKNSYTYKEYLCKFEIIIFLPVNIVLIAEYLLHVFMNNRIGDNECETMQRGRISVARVISRANNLRNTGEIGEHKV